MSGFRVAFDTTFFMIHYFSDNNRIVTKTREIIRRSRLQGNRGIIPTIVLSEFYAHAAKRIGTSEAERRFNEIVISGLDIVDLNLPICRKAGIIRHKYQEKIPWGDCLIAASTLETNCESVISEDPEFKSIHEIRCKKIEQVSI